MIYGGLFDGSAGFDSRESPVGLFLMSGVLVGLWVLDWRGAVLIGAYSLLE